jgi:hypothetical protein
MQVATVFCFVVRTVPSLYGPVNSLTVIVLVVAANQPCANVDSWSLPKSQRGVNLSEGVRPPGKYGCIFDVWTDFRFCIAADYLLTSRFVIDFGLW